ncbi:hypothetical protein WH51_05100 [Bacilli bacterium VT-13-104]|nr:hypothetical protein WH51_05100 [Bacilli bacterium VT-13-104]
MNSWKQKSDDFKVSICSTTYNHEQYIEDALTGFLMQKTDFPFEILIHDDASTDNTQAIIKDYEQRYPNIIKPIYQKENQYSQGIRVNLTFNYLRANGKYIALCEGDDYWTNEYKLQKQVDVMEKNNDIMLCVHATGVLKVLENKVESNKIKLNDGDKFIGAPEVILGGGEYGHTSSFVFRRNMIIDLPNWYIQYPAGDTPTRLLAAYKGYIYYLDKEMSVYRQGIEGSWTNRMKNDERFINHWKKSIEMFNEFDEYASYKYSKAIHKRKSKIAYSILNRIASSDNDQDMIKEYYSLLFGMDKMKYLLKIKFPHMFNILKAIKG